MPCPNFWDGLSQFLGRNRSIWTLARPILWDILSHHAGTLGETPSPRPLSVASQKAGSSLFHT